MFVSVSILICAKTTTSDCNIEKVWLLCSLPQYQAFTPRALMSWQFKCNSVTHHVTQL